MNFSMLQKYPYTLLLSTCKIGGQSGKNTSLTPTKTLPTRQDHSLVGFQIALSTFRFCVFITPVGIFVIEKCSPEL